MEDQAYVIVIIGLMMFITGCFGIGVARQARAEGRHARLVAEWATGLDTGLSSKALARASLGLLPRGKGHWDDLSHPYDAGDLGRCIRLVQHAPDAVKGLQVLAQYSPHWKVVAENWTRWLELYETLPKNKWGMPDGLSVVMRADYKSVEPKPMYGPKPY